MEELSMMEVDEERQRTRLEAIQKIMGEMGWRWFIAEINSEIEVIDNALRYCSSDELGRLQGRRDAFQQVIDFEDTVENLLSTETEDASV
jgi:hypothetical protein